MAQVPPPSPARPLEWGGGIASTDGSAGSQHLEAVQAASAPFVEFLTTSAWGKRTGEPGICDFVAGNPQDMALPEYVEAIRRASIPQNPN